MMITETGRAEHFRNLEPENQILVILSIGDLWESKIVNYMVDKLAKSWSNLAKRIGSFF